MRKVSNISIQGQISLGRSVVEVIQDLCLEAVVPGPGWVLGEGVAVEVAGDVTGTARVGVLPPGPSQLPGFLQDGEPVLSHSFPRSQCSAALT